MYCTNYQAILPEQMLSSIHRTRVTGTARDMVLPQVPVQITNRWQTHKLSSPQIGKIIKLYIHNPESRFMDHSDLNLLLSDNNFFETTFR